MSAGRILIIDDDSTIRAMLNDWLSEKYTVVQAPNGMRALEIMDQETFDLVLSDINMPGMNGFETLRQIRDKHRNVRTALITDYNVDAYIKMALEEDVTNIIVKNAPFQVDDLFRTVDNLITGERIFGLENYLEPGTPVALFKVLSSDDIESIREKFINHAEQNEALKARSNTLRMVFEEISSNALYHAYGYQKFQKVELRPEEVVLISFGSDSGKMGFSVLDHSGRLTKEIVLRKIMRAMSHDSILDTDGRGLFLTRSFSDRFIINIKRATQTEIIVINYFSVDESVNKPLYINQI